MRTYKNLIIPDLRANIKYRSLQSELLADSCVDHTCDGVDCSNCIFYSGNSTKRVVLHRELESGQVTAADLGHSSVKKQPPTVMADFATASDVFNPTETRIGVQVRVSNVADIDAVSECILSEYPAGAIHISRARILTSCEWNRDPEYAIPQIVIWWPEHKRSEAEKCRDRLTEVLSAKFGSGPSDDLKSFLREINACSDGTKFALQYSSMADVWDAMIDQDKWSYFDYVAAQLGYEQWRESKLVPNAKNRDVIKSLREMLDSRQSVADFWGKSFSKTFLKQLNPFPKPGEK